MRTLVAKIVRIWKALAELQVRAALRPARVTVPVRR